MVKPSPWAAREAEVHVRSTQHRSIPALIAYGHSSYPITDSTTLHWLVLLTVYRPPEADAFKAKAFWYMHRC